LERDQFTIVEEAIEMMIQDWRIENGSVNRQSSIVNRQLP